jgi:alkanesulfonate monooxygenase SsuD/methylene tetrahydromethanopterin reductase-like flavin-dependent oxidoreductase (luciferase family)
MTMRMLRAGTPIPVPTPERALAWLAAHGEPTDGWIPGRRAVIGTPDAVRAELERIAAGYQAEEVIVVTITHDHGARVRSYELLAEVFGLTPAAPTSGIRALA